MHLENLKLSLLLIWDLNLKWKLKFEFQWWLNGVWCFKPISIERPRSVQQQGTTTLIQTLIICHSSSLFKKKIIELYNYNFFKCILFNYYLWYRHQKG
jgi:hypothetical protein